MKTPYLLSLMSVALLLFGCSSGSTTDKYVDIMSRPTPERFSATEIRDYKGINLDPAIGPRDNSITGIQQVDIASYTLEVTGLVDNPLSMTYDEVLSLTPQEKLITLYCVEGWEATILWKGVRIMDIIDSANVKTGGEIVIFHAVDGYSTSIPLQEIKDKDMILAYSSNGTTLPEPMGYPFMVIAEDKLGYKWARWVNEIELSNDLNYQGTWEKRGYDNEAEIPGSRK